MKLQSCRKVEIITSMILMLGLVLPYNHAAAVSGSFYVAPNGNNSNACTMPSLPCLTMNGAIAKASPGASIFVAAGTYSGNQEAIVTIDKNITLSGGWDLLFSVQKNYSIIDGTGVDLSTTGYGLKINEGTTAAIDRFIIQNIRPTTAVYLSSYGILNFGNFTLNNSIVRNNSSNDSGGGIYNIGIMTIKHSTIEKNSANYSGGGIYNNNGASLTLINSNVSNNASYLDGGGIKTDETVTIINSTISFNKTVYSSGFGSDGGGLSSYYGVFNLVNSKVIGNSATGNGGGINSHGTLTMRNSVIKDNSSEQSGGGIYVDYATVDISNSTISSNSSSSEGGGVFNRMSSTLSISSSTINKNMAGKGGGIFITSEGTVDLKNSILADNMGSESPDCSGSVYSSGYNILGNSSGCNFISSGGDKLNTNPQIAYLVDVLGYNPLSPTSSAINAGNPGGCTDGSGSILAKDQRGAAREGRCDIGAYEYVSPGLPLNFYPVTGNNQRGSTLTEYPTKLSGVVTDKAGSPINQVKVTFTAPDQGPSGVFLNTASNKTSATTDQWGIVAIPQLSANSICGKYSLFASVGSTKLNGSFSLSNFAYISLPILLNRFCANFYDDFQSPASGWPIGEDAYLKTAYIGGEYQVLSKNADYLYLLRAPTCARNNYIVETDVRWVGGPGSSYGLIFGIQGNFEHYFIFDINTDYQAYRLYYFDGKSYHILQYETSSSAIHSGTSINHLQVIRNGEAITLAVNQNTLGTWNMFIENSGLTYAGVMTSPYDNRPTSDARFDNFQINDLLPGSNPNTLNGSESPDLKEDKITNFDHAWIIQENKITR